MNSAEIAKEVAAALAEDLGGGDVSAALLPVDCEVAAVILSREPMVVCGIPWVDAAFAQLDTQIKIEWLVTEAQYLEKPSDLCRVQGKARAVLSAERTALNFLQTLSATATLTHRYVEQLQGSNSRLLDTRKTIPGLRQAQKYAVRCGGGMNHRMGLYDAFLIKENHIKACGSLAEAVHLAKNQRPELQVEVEVESLEELEEALLALPDRILLDNFTLDRLRQAVVMTQGRCQLEASGGVHLDNIAQIAATGVDFISVGALTKSIQAIDLSLLIRSVL